MNHYCNYFGFKTDPFTSEISSKSLLKLPSMISVKERFEYVMKGGVFLITGEVGSGKSTSLRWSQAQFHPSQNLFLNITATGGSLIEFYRQLCWDLDIVVKSGSRSGIFKSFKSTVRENSSTKKQNIAIVVDEAHLLRVDIFAELHTIMQFEYRGTSQFSTKNPKSFSGALYSKYTQVPRLDRDLFQYLPTMVVEHIEEVEGLAHYLLKKDRENP